MEMIFHSLANKTHFHKKGYALGLFFFLLLQVKEVKASVRCYDNSDVIVALIITNFVLYLIQLWRNFFQIFVYGDVVYAQTWEILTRKNCI